MTCSNVRSRWFAALTVTLTALTAAAFATAAEDDAGFVSLFDGKSLDGWQGATNGYEVKDGILACKKGSGGKLMTKKEYADFTLRFEFRMEPGANNGVGLRAPLDGDAAYNGMESQILDDEAPQYKGIQPYQAHGSIYGIVPAKRGHLKKPGEWNSQEITCHGRHVTVKLNGATIVDADLDKASTPKTIDGRDHPGLKRSSGLIGFLGHGSRVEFRNIRIKELDAGANAK
jgi:hypothetical protein